MKFTDIRLQNFRSYKDSSFELSDAVTIIVGPNTAGKTNLLEAVLVSALGKSYRAPGKDLIAVGQDWARIDVHTSGNTQRTVKLTNDGDRASKIFEIDEKIYKRLPLASQQPTVLFEPNSLRLLEGDPSKRRAYIDEIISQTIPGYAKITRDYKRTLAQRNSLLKQSPSRNSVFVWDVKLTQLGEQIAKSRNRLINEINKSLTQKYEQIASAKKTLEIKYSSTLNLDNYGSNMLTTLEKTLQEDIKRGFTGVGPHRDDIEFFIAGRPTQLSASRGEMRTILLALKAIELEIIGKARGSKPLLLLDDVFSELDGARRKALTELVKDHQTIITTTDADIVTKNFSQKALLIAI